MTGLAAPMGFSVQPMDGAVNLTWRPASSGDVVGYNLYVKKPGSTNLALVNKRPINDTTVKLNHLFNGQNYSFALTSVSAAGRESSPVQLSAVPSGSTVVASGPLAPTGFKATLNATGDGIQLTWDKTSFGHNLYLVDAQGKPTRKLTSSPTVDPHIDLGKVNPTQTYQFVLTAVDSSGNESPATPVLSANLSALKNSAPSGPQAPAHLTAQIVDGKVHMTWDSAAGAVKYNVYVSHDGMNFTLLTKNGMTDTNATLGPIKSGITYIFGVTSLSADGKESDKAVQTLPAQ
jgi:fibronectin type 3 domain-containing protein